MEILIINVYTWQNYKAQLIWMMMSLLRALNIENAALGSRLNANSFLYQNCVLITGACITQTCVHVS